MLLFNNAISSTWVGNKRIAEDQFLKVYIKL